MVSDFSGEDKEEEFKLQRQKKIIENKVEEDQAEFSYSSFEKGNIEAH